MNIQNIITKKKKLTNGGFCFKNWKPKRISRKSYTKT